jgi:NADPH:quinone reductase-like Zn-dependent oxidoreductase
LINGASGGVGIFAIQVAKSLGAHVTAVCSTRNVEQSRALGADRVIDYTNDDFTREQEQYDVLLDIAGSKSFRACKRVLKPGARFVVIGGPMGTPLVGPLGHIAAVKISSLGNRRKTKFFIASFNRADMDTLREMLESGAIRPVVDEIYPFEKIGDALRKLGTGHVPGKLVVTI